MITLRLLRADVPTRYPTLKLYIVNLRGDVPFLARRIHDNAEDLSSFKHSPREDLRELSVEAAHFHGRSLYMALETYDGEKVMYGRGYPYFQDAKCTRAVTYIRDAFAAKAAERLLARNALALYGIDSARKS